ncbi:AAA family ATPase [Paenibacillus dendrobii]|nr:AAA family ATPase [Paenibacillus dendrobii]
MWGQAGYQVIEELGSNDEVSLYRVQRIEDHFRMIAKTTSDSYAGPSRVDSFQHEYEQLLKLKGRAALEPLRLEIIDHKPVLFCRDFRGTTLLQLMKSERQVLKLPALIEIATAVVEAIRHIHQEHILLNEITPMHLLIGDNFAEAKFIHLEACSTKVDGGEQDPALAKSGRSDSVLPYLSPELTGRTGMAASQRSDLYTLGVILYEWFAGVHPFSSLNALDWVHHHLAVTPAPIHEVNNSIPRIVSDMVHKCMEKMPEARYASAYGLKSDLEDCLIQLRITGRVQAFPIASRDVSESWMMPEGLFGRQREQQVLIQVMNKALAGAAAAVWVSGEAGIGKTALIVETLRKEIPPEAILVVVQADSAALGQPFALWKRVIEQLVSLLLASNQLEVEVWRLRVIDALEGYGGQLLIDWVPRLKLLMGEQAAASEAVREMPRAKDEAALHLALDRFFRLFFANDQPLVVFLDDLQWADEASFRYLSHLLIGKTKSLMIAGAYRDHEVTSQHPLRRLITMLRDRRTRTEMEQLHLARYDHADIKQMLGPMIRDTSERLDPFIDVLLHKTEGNPLFLKQFLQELLEVKLIYFDERNRIWEWDLGQIAEWNIPDQAAATLTGLMREMPDRLLRILAQASMLGKRFDLEALSILTGLGAEEGLDWARHVVDMRLLEPVPGARKSYIFQHDRIRQLSKGMLSDKERLELHYNIGWLMNHRKDSGEVIDVFEVLEHLNQASDMVIYQGKGRELVHLNLEAGLKAKQLGAYERAQVYLRLATELLDASCWSSCYDLSYQVYSERAEVEFLCDQLDCAHELYRLLLEKAPGDLDRVQIGVMLIRLELNRDQYEEARNLGSRCLEWLGMTCNLRPSPLQLLSHGLKIRRKLRKHPVDAMASLPPMINERHKLVMSVLVYMSTACFSLNESSWLSAIFTILEMTIDEGLTPEASIGFAGYAILLNYQFHRYEDAYKWGILACEVSKPDPKLYAQASNSFSLCYHSWMRYEPKLMLRFAEDLNQSVLQKVDLWHANQSVLINGALLFEFGHPLNEIYARLISHSADSMRNEHRLHWKQAAIFNELISRLTGYRPNDNPFQGTDIEAPSFYDHLSEGSRMVLQEYMDIYRYITRYLFGDIQGAYEALEHNSHKKMNEGDPSGFCFYRVLVMKKRYEAGSPQEKRTILPTIRQCVKKLRGLARRCPEMNAHKYLLAKAALSELKRNHRTAERQYEEALAAAHRRGYLHDAAIIAECFAQYGIRNGKSMIAKLYMNESYEMYLKWGALAKAEDLQGKYGHLLNIKQDTDLERMDYLSVAISAQALSSEMEMNRLMDKLLGIMLQNAGAEYGALIFENEDQWFVEAYGTMEKLYVESIPLEAAGHLVPTSIIGYAVRTREEVVLSDAQGSDAFKRSEYIRGRDIRSVLCLPIMHQNKLICLLYMENNLSTGMFTKARLDVLRLLSSQCAISIDNAKLYTGIQYLKNNLEAEVEERTRSLEKSMQITSEALAEATIYAERTRIAQEIHDIVGHTLTSTILQIEAGKRLLDRDMDSARVRLQEAQNSVRHSLSEIRNSVHMLKEDKYYELEDAMHLMISDTERNAGVSIHAVIDPVEHLSLMQKKVIYHALQEGLTNGIRHGKSSEFSFSLRDDGVSVQFRLADNGLGASRIDMGFGLKMMRERVKQLKGTLYVDSEPGKGCLLRLNLPYSMP